MTRSFIAIEVPEEIRKNIHASLDKVRRQTSGVKWLEISAMHLTLRFLGEVDEKLLEKEIAPRLKAWAAGGNALQLKVEGVGLFPSVAKPRIFWVGLNGQVVELKRMQAALEKILEGLPIHQEEKEFHPHLTLGRIKVPGAIKVWQKILEEYEKIEFGNFSAQAVVLFKSELTRTGPVYTKLKEFKFV